MTRGDHAHVLLPRGVRNTGISEFRDRDVRAHSSCERRFRAAAICSSVNSSYCTLFTFFITSASHPHRQRRPASPGSRPGQQCVQNRRTIKEGVLVVTAVVQVTPLLEGGRRAARRNAMYSHFCAPFCTSNNSVSKFIARPGRQLSTRCHCLAAAGRRRAPRRAAARRRTLSR